MSNELATTQKRSLVAELADAAGLEPAKFYDAIKEQCGCRGATDGHFAALLMQAKTYDLNPMLRELWLFPGQGNIRPTISHDGWFKILTRHPRYIHHTYRVGEDDDGKYGEVLIWTRESVAHGLPPYDHREYLSEVRKGPTWKSHPRRMLRGRTISQGARHCFGIAGMDVTEAAWDEPEADDEPVDVTPAIEIKSLTSGVHIESLTTAGEEGAGSPGQDDGGQVSEQDAPDLQTEAAPAFDADASLAADRELFE